MYSLFIHHSDGKIERIDLPNGLQGGGEAIAAKFQEQRRKYEAGDITIYPSWTNPPKDVGGGFRNEL